jgi:hypothetical protein
VPNKEVTKWLKNAQKIPIFAPPRAAVMWRRRRIYYTGAVPQLEQPVYYEDLGNSL